jgi:hypothetical protein
MQRGEDFAHRQPHHAVEHVREQAERGGAGLGAMVFWI